ncbi:MAG: hypothetical protein AB7Q17_04295 [Phycisphaerae bacterium]
MTRAAFRHPVPQLALLLGLATPLLMGGCGSAVNYLTEERSGNITFIFVNNTSVRASFSFGTYDSLDRPDGPASLQQLRLEAMTSSAATNVTCRRNAVVGTQEFINRVIQTDGDEGANFDADAFDDVVHFSSAPQNSPLAAIATDGTAAGVDKLLGVDYTCGDTLIFTFNADPAAPGGFRIDFQVIQDVEDN